MSKRVVADTSPLIGLAAAGAFDCLHGLFDTVTISRTVLEEIRAGGKLPGAAELEAALREGWIRVAPAPAETWRFVELDTGEASTIALAARPDSDGPALVLMDDVRGRAEAAALGLETLGLAELLSAAKRAGLVAHVRPLFERLARRGITLPREAVRAALAHAGEGHEEPHDTPTP